MAQTLKKEHCNALFIGGSAGSLDVLLEVFPNLNANINFPIIIIIHRKSGRESLLTSLLQGRTPLKVHEAEEKEFLAPGNVYIAPADYHLLVEHNQTISLDYSEKINYSRPSIDVSFQSAAEVYQENLICILLSGSNADGVDGLKTVKAFGGKAIIQNPETAVMPYMPQQAKLNVEVDYILNATDIARFINNLSSDKTN